MKKEEGPKEKERGREKGEKGEINYNGDTEIERTKGNSGAGIIDFVTANKVARWRAIEETLSRAARR